jgi:dTDP-4-dehydrorhamnose reductase
VQISEEHPVLIAGRTGQVARSLVDEARTAALPVIALGRPELDIGDPQSIGRAVAAIAPSAIVNAAAYTSVDKAESDVEGAFAINRDGAGWLAAAAAAARIPFIHLSTDYVFDGSKTTPYVEEDATGPLGIYGRSKLEGEAVVQGACPSALVLRTSWIYSPYGQNFVRTMLSLAETRDIVRVVDDQHGSPTAAGDLATAILGLTQSILKSTAQGGVYHLAAPGSTTWYDLAAAIFAGWKERGRRVPTLEPISTSGYPTAARRPANSRLDCTKIHRVYGVRLPPWRASLAECLDAFASHQAGREQC